MSKCLRTIPGKFANFGSAILYIKIVPTVEFTIFRKKKKQNKTFIRSMDEMKYS